MQHSLTHSPCLSLVHQCPFRLFDSLFDEVTCIGNVTLDAVDFIALLFDQGRHVHEQVVHFSDALLQFHDFLVSCFNVSQCLTCLLCVHFDL